jgi:hypothetical protein
MVNTTFEEDKSIFKLEICVAKWDVLMMGYFVIVTQCQLFNARWQL